MKAKAILLTGVLALVVIGCVLAAGCTSAPTTEQQTVDEPAVYDYSDMDNWMYFADNPTKDVDAIFIIGTTVSESDYDSGIGIMTDDLKKAAKVVSDTGSGSTFSEYTNVYAPYYDQISLEKAVEAKYHDVFMDTVRKNVGLKDVTAALDYYFENCNNGRPYILYGHSQGAALTLLVLEDYMKEHPEYYKNMIAAYAIGFGVTEEWLNANPHVKFAQGEDDTGVVISWNTEGPNATMNSLVIGDKPVLLINPLTWKTDETYADKSLNTGSLITGDDGTPSIVAGLNDAQIDAERGALICTTNTDYLSDNTSLAIVGDKSLHTLDYNLYYRNIQENGLKRIQAFLDNQQ